MRLTQKMLRVMLALAAGVAVSQAQTTTTSTRAVATPSTTETDTAVAKPSSTETDTTTTTDRESTLPSTTTADETTTSSSRTSTVEDRKTAGDEETTSSSSASRSGAAPSAAGNKVASGPATDTSAPNPEETIEEVVYTGPLPQSCLSPNVKYTSEVLTDFIPVYREARQCQQACQAHGECYFWTWNEGKAGALSDIPEEGEEIELFVPEYTYEEGQRRALAFADYQPAPRPARRMRSLQDKLPTADEILADPPAGACFLFGPYVKTSSATAVISGPRTCADECSALYSANCKYSRCCARATATCVSKDSFFAQCRLPTDACPGRGWNCYNVSSTPLGCLEYDTEYAPDVFGNDLEEILDVPTELHCQELCKNHDKCNYWSYNPWYKHMCLLKKKNRPKRAAKGIISGTKECAGFSQPETLYYLGESPEYSTFYALLRKVGLIEYIEKKTADAANGNGGITLLVPTNRAFEALPTTIERKLKESDELLKKLMLYHMIDKPVWIDRTIGDKTFTAIKSASGDDIGLSRRASAGGALRINDADVLILDLRTSDGMINLITDVLVPPSLAENISGDLDDLDGTVRGQGVASLLEEEDEPVEDASTPAKTTAKPTSRVTTTTTAPTTRATTTTTKAADEDSEETTTTSTTTTITPTTTTPSTATRARPSEDASTIMGSVDVARPTPTPDGTMPSTGRAVAVDETEKPEENKGSSVGVSDFTNGDVTNNVDAIERDFEAAQREAAVESDNSSDEVEVDSSSGLFGMGSLGIVVLVLIIALVLGVAGAAILFFKKRQQQKRIEEAAVEAAEAPHVDYASR